VACPGLPKAYGSAGLCAAASAPGKTAGNPSIAMNDGSVNIAVEGEPGDLWFFWQDSSGAFHQETVDTSANLS
jgi:hypothetical protein